MMSPRMMFLTAMLVVLAYMLNGRGTKYRIIAKPSPEYDYIIVGAGTSGCVLASRLAEDSSVSVLLLEAGGEDSDNPDTDIPLAAAALRHSEYAQRDLTAPQTQACLGMHEKQCAVLHGRGLGGSSLLDTLVYSRGNRGDYDSWSQQGAAGWSYEHVLPYFIKAEANSNHKFLQSGFHGDVGPLVVSDVRATSLSEAFLEAGQELGYQATDINGESQSGFMHTQATISRGRRWGVTKAYLQPAMYRKNLHLLTNAFVTKVLFQDKMAMGVEFQHNSTTHQVMARKEVIVAAGTIGSAHLLLLSGIGPREHLREMKIREVADLPVGENLQDQLTLKAPEFVLKEPIGITTFKASSFWVWMDFFLFGTGIF